MRAHAKELYVKYIVNYIKISQKLNQKGSNRDKSFQNDVAGTKDPTQNKSWLPYLQ